jgi:hypothetical protein
MTPTTSMGEANRIIDSNMASLPGSHESVKQISGVISEVHPERPFIKAYNSNGNRIANDNFIPLNHSPSEIIEKWGTIRVGMKVIVSYCGPNGTSANATIVGLEGGKENEEPYLPNNIERGMFRIFSPGIGVG